MTSGMDRQLHPYTQSISSTTPLHISLNCPYVESGIIQYQQIVGTVTKTSSINYGNASTNTCDNKATVSFNGTTYVITLNGSN